MEAPAGAFCYRIPRHEKTGKAMAIRFERNDLYETVWRTSPGSLARELGIPTSTLKDVCRRMAVPMPPAFYWRKLKAGETMERSPLPPYEGPETITVSTQRKGAQHRPDGWLAEWVAKSQDATPAPPVRKQSPRPAPPPSAATSKQSPRFVPIRVWAEMMFGEHAPHKNTLRNWINSGRIHPRPRKIGRSWYVQPDAEYVED